MASFYKWLGLGQGSLVRQHKKISQFFKGSPVGCSQPSDGGCKFNGPRMALFYKWLGLGPSPSVRQHKYFPFSECHPRYYFWQHRKGCENVGPRMALSIDG